MIFFKSQSRIKTLQICSLLLWSISFSIVNGQNNQYFSFKEGITGKNQANTEPERLVINGGALFIEIDYQFEGTYITETEVEGDKYNFLHIEGFAKMCQVGAPALPAHNEIIAMPVNAMGNIVVVEAEFLEYDGFMIHPALEPARDVEGAPEPEFQKDPKIYNADEFFPHDVVEITDILLSRETPLAVTQVRPVQFNPVSGKIRVYSKIRYRLDFIGGEGSFNSLRQVNSVFYTNLLKLNVINSESIPEGVSYNPNGSRSGEKDYIIITHDQYLSTANDLADWKRQLGYSVEVVSQASWTAGQVKTAIHDRYNSWTPKPDYFVIIGDHSGPYAVPGEIHQDPYYGNDFATDLYYACMGGAGDWVPDMAHGRISVSSATEAQVVIDKITNYEKDPVNDASFYQNGLNCAQYQDDSHAGYADRRFCHTSENIRDYLQDDQGYTSERVYYTGTTANVTTLHYNNTYYSNGELLSADLRSTSFNWNGGSSDITSAINSGKFYVFHRDHGFAGGSGWAHPYYTTTSMSSLLNGNKLPVVFSINCHSGEFQLSNCFAEKFLRMENKGAVGVVAAAYYSYSGYNDALSIGMIDAIWPDPGLYAVFGSGGTGANYTTGAGNNVYTMGDVVNQGLVAMVQNWGNSGYQHELFHWFGDPAMKIWTSNPNDSIITASHSTVLSCAGTLFSITSSTAGATATLVYNEQLIGKTVLDASGDGTITYTVTSPGATATLTISKHNHKPYVTTLNLSGSCAFTPGVITIAATGMSWNSTTGNGEIMNDYGSTVTESGIVYSLIPGPQIGDTGVISIQTSPTDTTGTFAVLLTGLNSNTTYYFRAYAINANGIGYGDNMTLTTLCVPTTLPWVEDWEDAGPLTTFTSDNSSLTGIPEWSYDMVNDGGRLRFEAGSGFYHSGLKAATLDRAMSGGVNTNYLIAGLNLINYMNADSLSLSFYYMHHGEEPHSNDRVWVRGSNNDAWVEIYDLYLNQGSAGSWNHVVDLDIYAFLAAASPVQTVSSTFQIRFGQEDNYPATTITASDGYTFDDITINGPAQALWAGTTSTDWNTASNWCSGTVPDETVDIIIYGGASNYPVLNDDLSIHSSEGACRCKNLTIKNGGRLEINQGFQMIVNGNVTIETGGILHTGK